MNAEISRWQGRRLFWAVVGVAIVAAFAAAAGAPLRSTYYERLTADEPHYLLTAISLAEDGSLDVSDEFAAERYRPFYEIRLDPQAKQLPSGRLVEPHDPGLPALLAIPMKLGGWMAARLTLAVIAGLLAGLTLWTAVRRFGASLPAATVAVGIFGVSAPLAVYGSLVYPELPAALAITVAVACIAGRLSPSALAGLAVSVVGLAWLGTKYIPVAAVLASTGLWRLFRAGRRKEVMWTAAFFALAGAGYLIAHLRWYGGLTAYAAGAHFAQTGEFSVVGVTPNYLQRTMRLSGLFVDRQFGLAAWQPAWLLLLPAVGRLLRARPANWLLLALPLAAGWLGATYIALTMQGWWFPGRHVVAILPLAVVTMSIWLTGSARRMATFAVAGSIGIVNLAWLFWEVAHNRLTLVVDFYRTTNPLYRAAAALLPDYQHPSAGTEALHALWTAICLGLLWAGAGFPGRDRLARLRLRSRALEAKRP